MENSKEFSIFLMSAKIMTIKKGAYFTDIHFGRRNSCAIHNQDCTDFIEWFCGNVRKDPSITWRVGPAMEASEEDPRAAVSRNSSRNSRISKLKAQRAPRRKLARGNRSPSPRSRYRPTVRRWGRWVTRPADTTGGCEWLRRLVPARKHSFVPARW